MKTAGKERKTFYIHQIERKNSPKKEEEKVDINKPVKQKKNSELAENVGYHLDPSRYDSLRTYNPKTDVKRDIKKPVEEKKVKPVKKVIKENEDNKIYEKMADEFYENDSNETIINEIISEEEMDELVSKNNVTPELFEEESKEEAKETLDLEDDEEDVVEDIEPEEVVEHHQIIEESKEEAVDNSEELIEIEDKPNPFKDIKKTVEENRKTQVNVEVKKEESTNEYKPHKYGKYVAPSLDLLKKSSGHTDDDISYAENQKAQIDEILKSYNIKAHVEKYLFGPTVIVYFIKFETLLEDVNSIRKCEKNLQMYLQTQNIRMLTPIPNMPFAGIEVPRPADNRGMVYLGDMLSDKDFINSRFKLPVAVGMDNFNHKIYIDLTNMPHGLAAGASQSGKSVSLNTFILSLIYHFTPDDVRLVLVDPKVVEFSRYEDIPHLAAPVITNQEFFEPIMEWLTNEMERRYLILNKFGCVNLAELNEVLVEKKQPKMPYIVMIMDEFNDWFLEASNNVQVYTTRLMQKARAAGINIILATQRPSADVIKGAIKANLTTRFAFRVASFADSSVILGQAGAEKLEGYGDMILRYTGMDDTRLQAAFVSTSEIKNVVDFLRDNNETDYIITLEELQQSATSRGAGNGSSDPSIGRNDEIFEEVALYVVRNQNASVNQLQKIFGTGFNRMDTICRDLEKLGIISPAQQGTKRKVLVNEIELEDILKGI